MYVKYHKWSTLNGVFTKQLHEKLTGVPLRNKYNNGHRIGMRDKTRTSKTMSKTQKPRLMAKGPGLAASGSQTCNTSLPMVSSDVDVRPSADTRHLLLKDVTNVAIKSTSVARCLTSNKLLVVIRHLATSH